MGGSPSLPAATPTPKYTDPAVQEAIKKEAELAERRKGRKSTMLTSGMGLTGDTEKRTMLG
jgi:hypothetical protein